MPGRIDTERLQALDKGNAKLAGISEEEIRQNAMSGIPLRRYANIEEIGKAGAFLLSPAASYITGVSLAVDGGIMKTVW